MQRQGHRTGEVKLDIQGVVERLEDGFDGGMEMDFIQEKALDAVVLVEFPYDLEKIGIAVKRVQRQVEAVRAGLGGQLSQ